MRTHTQLYSWIYILECILTRTLIQSTVLSHTYKHALLYSLICVLYSHIQSLLVSHMQSLVLSRACTLSYYSHM